MDGSSYEGTKQEIEKLNQKSEREQETEAR